MCFKLHIKSYTVIYFFRHNILHHNWWPQLFLRDYPDYSYRGYWSATNEQRRNLWSLYQVRRKIHEIIVKCLCMLHPHKYNMFRRRSVEEAMIIKSWTATLVATYKNCVVMWHHPEISDCSWVTSSLKRRWYPQPWIQNGGRALSFATSIRQATSFRLKSKLFCTFYISASLTSDVLKSLESF